MPTAQQTPQGNPYDGPPYPAAWQVDTSQSAKELTDRHGRNAANPAAHQVFREHLERKEREFGVIHVDPATGYRARFKPQGAASGQAPGAGGRGAEGGQARGEVLSGAPVASPLGAGAGGAAGESPDQELARLRREMADRNRGAAG